MIKCNKDDVAKGCFGPAAYDSIFRDKSMYECGYRPFGSKKSPFVEYGHFGVHLLRSSCLCWIQVWNAKIIQDKHGNYRAIVIANFCVTHVYVE